MSAKKKTRPVRAVTKPTTQEKTAGAPGARTADSSTPANARTDTENALVQALDTQNARTTTELALAAGIGKSTAGKLLARWEKMGLVTRIEPADGNRGPARWTAASGEEAQPETGPTQHGAGQEKPNLSVVHDAAGHSEQRPPQIDLPATSEMRRGDSVSKRGRLAPGGLRGLVEDYLRDNSGAAFGPHEIGRALNRSSGAVNNALEKLVADGYAMKTQDAPKRFALADPAE